MALYPTCQHSICNIEFIHGCYTISVVYQSMHCLFMSCVKYMVKTDDSSTDVSSWCFRACPIPLLVHPKGGSPGGARVVISYTAVVLDMRDPVDMTVLHGVTRVDGRWSHARPCPSFVVHHVRVFS